MAGVIKSSAKVTTGYLTDKTVTDRIKNLIDKRINQLQTKPVEIVKEIIRDVVTNSLVYKGLDGAFPNIQGSDLQAEFGIKNPKPALDRLTDVLVDTVKIDSASKEDKQAGRSAIAAITIKYLDPADYEDKLMNDPIFVEQSYRLSYKKRGKSKKAVRVFTESYAIEWMKILLDGSFNAPEKYIPDIQNYGITYNIKDFEARVISRSGRAIMTKRPERTTRLLGRRGNVKLGSLKSNLPPSLANMMVNFPYTMPKLAIPKAGRKNFIDELARSAALKSRIKAALDKIIKDIVSPRKR